MNACGVDKACKSNGISHFFSRLAERFVEYSGRRASNTLVTYPRVRNKPSKGGLMSDGPERVKKKFALGGA